METYNFIFLECVEFYYETTSISKALLNNTWCVYNEHGEKDIYIFQKDGTIIKSQNGKITSCSYLYIHENESIIINDIEQYLIKLLFHSNVIVILQIEGRNGFAILINESIWDSFDINDKLIQKLFNYEIKRKSNQIKKELKTSPVKKSIIKIFLGYLFSIPILYIFDNYKNVPEDIFFAFVGILIGLFLFIIVLVCIIVNKTCEHKDRRRIQKWKEKHPNNPLNNYI